MNLALEILALLLLGFAMYKLGYRHGLKWALGEIERTEARLKQSACLGVQDMVEPDPDLKATSEKGGDER